MLKVEISSTATKQLSGVSGKTGKPYAFQTQSAHIWTLDPVTKQSNRHPEKFELMLDKEEQPHAIGFYELELSSIYVNNGRLNVSPRIAPVKLSALKTA